MQSNFKVLSLSFKNAPVEIREMIALDEILIAALLSDFRAILSLEESLIISTCNRTEVYYNAENDLSKEIITLMASKKGISNIEEFIPFFSIINDSDEASTYLFRVTWT